MVLEPSDIAAQALRFCARTGVRAHLSGVRLPFFDRLIEAKTEVEIRSAALP
jgi:hypothetical protein